MKAYHDKQFLIFDFEDGKTVKYDLSTNKLIGKRGAPVKSLSSQLSGYSIDQVINSFEDEKYVLFLKWVRQQVKGHFHYSNLGTFLSKIEKYSRFEQYFAAGITDISDHLRYTITELPKGLLKLAIKYNFKLTNDIVLRYTTHADIIRNMFEMEFCSITSANITYMLDSNYYWGAFHTLITQHKYKYDSLIKYIDNLMTYEGLDNFLSVLIELRDYAGMASKLSIKFEKYPRWFLSTHKIAVRNYNRLKAEFPEDLFKNCIRENLECSIGEYKVIYPKSTQDIKDEAVSQCNCLASYIDKVLSGGCHILFMRKKDNMDSSLITLEVRGNTVVQAKGRYNRDPNSEEQEMIDLYNKKISGKRNCA